MYQVFNNFNQCVFIGATRLSASCWARRNHRYEEDIDWQSLYYIKLVL